ncbi:hypothetical protein ACP4OV_029435 [Aristida adscensionis]
MDKKVCVASSAGSCSSPTPTADPAFLKDKVYLKNLFHCIRALPALNCSLVFFTDGAIPLLKLATYMRRLGSTAERVEEAEAQCALLNLASLCDGCSTSDSDAIFFVQGQFTETFL